MARRLTEEQQRVVDCAAGAAVTAGAGTGKTELMAERYLRHLEQDGRRPLEVVAVTFTEAAAGELRARIRRRLVDRPAPREDWLAELEAAPIGTLHALCRRLCSDHPGPAEVAPLAQVLDEAEARVWTAAQLDDALSALPDALFGAHGLPFSLAREALRRLLDDPVLGERALAKERVPAAEWRRYCESLSAAMARAVVDSDAWRECVAIVHDQHGPADDNVEIKRQEFVAGLEQAATAPADALPAIGALTLARGGSSRNWRDITEMREALKWLRDSAKKAAAALYVPGEVEDRHYELLQALVSAYDQVSQTIAASKRAAGVLTFADLEAGALRALRNPAVREWYGRRWRAFIVDECQDLNPVQRDLLEALVAASPDAPVTLVGDEKQAIYGFRGADPDLFAELREVLVQQRGGEAFQLSRSFRSHRPLVEEAINPLFEQVLDHYETLHADRPDDPTNGPALELACVRAAEDEKVPLEALRRVEAAFVADRVAGWLAEPLPIWDKPSGAVRGLEPGDVAILSRAWAPLELYGEALAARGIPVVHTGGGSLLETREAKDGWALLRFLATPADNVALAAVLRSPFAAVDDGRLLALARRVPAADEDGRRPSWWDVLRDQAAELGLDAAREVLAELVEAAAAEPPSWLLTRADDLTGYSAVLANLPLADRRLADWQGFGAWVREAERGHEDVLAIGRQLQRYAELTIELPRPPLEARDAVTLSSIHHAKGLEWPVVIVPDLARRDPPKGAKLLFEPAWGVGLSFRHSNAAKDDQPFLFRLLADRADERATSELRRIAYVAITRARDRVLLTTPHWAAKSGLLGALAEGLAALGLPGSGRPGVAEEALDEALVYTAERAIPPLPLPPGPAAPPAAVLLDPVPATRRDLPVTALDVYAGCPRRFRFLFVDGHPGLAPEEQDDDGDRPSGTDAATLGNLVHQALELGLQDEAAVRRLAAQTCPGLAVQRVDEAVTMVEAWYRNPAFDPVRGASDEQETAFCATVEGLRLTGRIDRVGPAHLVDYKTGRRVTAADHRMQLWVYTQHCPGRRAWLAALREPARLIEVTPADLAAGAAQVSAVAAGIREGRYEARPDAARCGFCQYRRACDDAVG